MKRHTELMKLLTRFNPQLSPLSEETRSIHIKNDLFEVLIDIPDDNEDIAYYGDNYKDIKIKGTSAKVEDIVSEVKNLDWRVKNKYIGNESTLDALYRIKKFLQNGKVFEAIEGIDNIIHNCEIYLEEKIGQYKVW